MKLRKARVTNYRSVNDSGEFSVTDLTCLVGKNESGKTTILQALSGLQPIGDDPKLKYDKQRDYPRRHLTQYAQRHGDEEAEVLRTTWELDDEDVAVVEELLGPGCLESRQVEMVKYYGAKRTWTVLVAEPKVVAFLIEDSGLSKPEKGALKAPATVRELRAALASKDTPSPAAQALMKRIEGFRNQSPQLAAIDVLFPRAPRFLYFSNYNRMVGSISLDQLIQVTSQKSVTPEQSVYLDFLDFSEPV